MIVQRLRLLIASLLVGAVLAAGLVLASGSRPVDSFQGANEFQLWVSGTVIENDGDSAWITIAVAPAQTQASAIRGSLAFDSNFIEFQNCDALVQWVSCTESAPGTVLFEAVTATQWSEPTDLLRVNVIGTGLVETSVLDVTIEQGLAASTAELSGNAVDAKIGPLQSGDVTCNASVDVTDAMVIAQFDAGTREATTTCPVADPTTQLNERVADFNGDGKSDVIDALLIAQCSVGLTNPFCDG